MTQYHWSHSGPPSGMGPLQQWLSVPNLIIQDFPVASGSFERVPNNHIQNSSTFCWLTKSWNTWHTTHDCKIILCVHEPISSLDGEKLCAGQVYSQVDALRSLHIATNTSLNIVPLSAKYLVCMCVCVCVCVCVCGEDRKTENNVIRCESGITVTRPLPATLLVHCCTS